MNNRHLKIDPVKMQAARLMRGLTLEELGARIDYSHAALSYIEQGQTKNPTPRLIQRLTSILGIDILVGSEP